MLYIHVLRVIPDFYECYVSEVYSFRFILHRVRAVKVHQYFYFQGKIKTIFFVNTMEKNGKEHETSKASLEFCHEGTLCLFYVWLSRFNLL